MLGKLIKYEWQATWKLLVPVNLLTLVTSFFTWITWRLDVKGSLAMDMAAVMILLTYVLSLFMVLIGSAVYLVWHFYTSTYSDQGYLLHTLPVDKHHIIIAKVLVSTIWIIISMFLIYVSLFLVFDSDFKDWGFWVFEVLRSIATESYSDVGSMFTAAMGIIALIVGMFARVLKVTACISLGQLSADHKLLTSFGFFFAVQIIQQILNTIYQVAILSIINRTGEFTYDTMWEYSLITGLIYVVVFYLITWYVMEKKLNLD